MAGDTNDPNRAVVLAAHYQHVAEMSYRLWEERNRRFLHLMAVVALAVLLTYDAQTIVQVGLKTLEKSYGLPLPERVAESLPYVVLHGLLLAFVFYLMTDVYRLTSNIMSNTEYRKGLEKDLRGVLCLTDSQSSYSYESRYRSWNQSGLKRVVGWIYVLLLGAMLVLFLVFRLTSDWPANGFDPAAAASWKDLLRQHFLLIADVVVGGATLLMYAGYAWLSLRPAASETAVSYNLAQSSQL